MKVYELLDKPEKWIKYENARDKDGVSISPRDPQAACWCFYGALVKCYGDGGFTPVEEKVENELRPLNLGYLSWNDSPERKYEDVIELCKKLDI